MIENAIGEIMGYTTTISAVMDGVALLLLIIFAVGGAKKGFVKTFFGVFGTIISLILAALLCAAVAKVLESKFGLVGTISGWVSGKLDGIFGAEAMSIPLSEATEEHLSEAGVSGFLIKIILSIKEGATVEGDPALRDVIAPVFGFYITAGICAIGLFIIFKLIFVILGSIFQKLHDLPVIGSVDKLLGFALGIIQGAIVIEIIILLIGIIPIEQVQNLSAEIPNTILTAFLNDVNIYRMIVNAISNVKWDEIINGISGE